MQFDRGETFQQSLHAAGFLPASVTKDTKTIFYLSAQSMCQVMKNEFTNVIFLIYSSSVSPCLTFYLQTHNFVPSSPTPLNVFLFLDIIYSRIPPFCILLSPYIGFSHSSLPFFVPPPGLLGITAGNSAGSWGGVPPLRSL